MKKLQVACVVLAAASVQAATPVVSNVSYEQDAAKVVHIRYSLSGEPGIVTVECLTNGAAISPACLVNAGGAVNRLVQPGANNEIVWKARRTFRDQRFDTGVSFRVTAWATNCPPPYMAVDLSETNGAIRYYASAEAVPGGVTNDVYKTDVLLFRKVTARGVRWLMGNNPEYWELNDASRRPLVVAQARHRVTLSDDYYLGVYEFTLGQYGHCAGTTYSASATRLPNGGVSYNTLRGATDGDFTGWPTDGHAVKAGSRIAALRAYLGLAVDLPTEAQWEYACRAGTESPYYFAPDNRVGGQDVKNMCTNYAWTIENTKNAGSAGTKPVGHWSANPWGFYDMYGNVGEWCLDWFESWEPASYAKDQIDPTGPTTGTRRLTRGGNCNDNTGYAYSFDRRYNENPTTGYSNYGYRLACPAIAPR